MVQLLTYLEKETSYQDKYMEVFNWRLYVKLNLNYSNHTRDLLDKNPDSVMDLDLEYGQFKAHFNRFIYKESVLHAYEYYKGELGEPNPYMNMYIGICTIKLVND